MKVPFHKPYITEDEIRSVAELLREGWLTSGDRTASFEELFREYIGSPYALSVNSATAALHLSLAAIGLSQDDEVLVPALTHASSAEVVRYFNAMPVLVDIERETHLLDSSRIEEKITKKTRAIIPVHYGGQACDMDEILSIAKKYNLYVIEDAAHALPSWYRDRKVGTIGDLTCFSFYATKTLTTGEGGMICTGNEDWARRMGVLRLHGVNRDAWERHNSSRFWQYDVEETGYKYNTTDIAAAIGIEQLKKLEFMWKKRERVAARYDLALSGRDEIINYTIRPGRVSSRHLYPVDLNIEALSIGRDEFVEQMQARGVGLSVHFIPLYEFTVYKNMGYRRADFENCNWVFERTISLPIFPGMTDPEIDYVIDSLLDIVIKNRR